MSIFLEVVEDKQKHACAKLVLPPLKEEDSIKKLNENYKTQLIKKHKATATKMLTKDTLYQIREDTSQSSWTEAKDARIPNVKYYYF